MYNVIFSSFFFTDMTMSSKPTDTQSTFVAEETAAAEEATNNKPVKKQTTRKVFSHQAQLELENAFRISPYLTAWKRQCLSQKLSLTERQVRVWFQNRRMRIKSERRLQQRQTNSTHQNTNKYSPPPDYMSAITTTTSVACFESSPCSVNGIATQPYTTFDANQFQASQLPIYTNSNGCSGDGFYTQPTPQIQPFDYTNSSYFNGKTNNYQSSYYGSQQQQQQQQQLQLPQPLHHITQISQQQQQQQQQLQQQHMFPQQISPVLHQHQAVVSRQDNETENFLNNFDISELRALTTTASFQTDNTAVDILSAYGSVI